MQVVVFRPCTGFGLLILWIKHSAFARLCSDALEMLFSGEGDFVDVWREGKARGERGT